jgi:hypothetical protein
MAGFIGRGTSFLVTVNASQCLAERGPADGESTKPGLHQDGALAHANRTIALHRYHRSWRCSPLTGS